MRVFNRNKAITAVVFLVLATVIMIPGCQSSRANMATTQPGVSAPGDRAVACDKCRTVWVWRSSRTHKGMTAYSRKPRMVCENCTAVAADFFKTGRLDHVCKSCGGTLEVCEGDQQ